MTNLELLQDAAKAAGTPFVNLLLHGKWNPLAYDGDALRLSVDLRMNVFHASCRVYAMDENGDIEVSEGHERDPLAATRRAIVRAAAAMAKDRP